MSYEPTEWQCGDSVTADRMNKMERGIADMNSEYIPNEWSCGDVITADKLNHMEQGIANGGGGGGSSDFSTAEVTVVSNELHNIKIAAPCLNRGYVIPIDETMQTTNFTAVLGENGCVVQLYGNDFATVNVALSGGIADMGDGYYAVTGDCTITIS